MTIQDITAMATAPLSHMASIEDFTAEQGLNFLTPSHPDFESTRRSYIRIPSPPLGIIQPKTESQVAELLKLCTTLNIPFSVRTGGHDHLGRGMVPSSLCIDMRSIAYVRLSNDHSTARVGGGTLLRQVADELAEHGLVTTLGNVGSVGYVGFATIAGYGPLGPKFGLAVDQIVGARIVDAEGRIKECEEKYLVGIRGGGPALGIILELTIKVYRLQQVLGGAVIYDSTDFAAAMRKWAFEYNCLTKAGIPDSLYISLCTLTIPQVGRCLMSVFMWCSDDHEEGQRWLEKVKGFGACLMTQVSPTRISDLMEQNETLLPMENYGNVNTVSVKGYTHKITEIIIKHTDKLPGGHAMLYVNMLCGKSALENQSSVFGPREPHLVLEFLSATPDESLVNKCNAWASAFKRDILENAGEDVVGGGFPSLTPKEECDWKKIYGNKYSTFKALKDEMDPANVFNQFIPSL